MFAEVVRPIFDEDDETVVPAVVVCSVVDLVEFPEYWTTFRGFLFREVSRENSESEGILEMSLYVEFSVCRFSLFSSAVADGEGPVPKRTNFQKKF